MVFGSAMRGPPTPSGRKTCKSGMPLFSDCTAGLIALELSALRVLAAFGWPVESYCGVLTDALRGRRGPRCQLQHLAAKPRHGIVRYHYVSAAQDVGDDCVKRPLAPSSAMPSLSGSSS